MKAQIVPVTDSEGSADRDAGQPRAAACRNEFSDSAPSSDEEATEGAAYSSKEFFRDAIDAFAQSGQLAKKIGSSVIEQEAKMAKKRFLHLDECAQSLKRAKVATAPQQKPQQPRQFERRQDQHPRARILQDLSPQDSQTTAQDLVALREEVSICNQAFRAKRMSLLLLQLERTHEMLLQELIRSAAEASISEPVPHLPDADKSE